MFLWAALPWGFSALGAARHGKPMKPMRAASEIQVKLLVHETGEIWDMGLEDYLVGVLAAEMPASFEPEALKAQAVAARTYAIRRLRQGGDPQVAEIQPGAQLTTDHQINQAWISQKEMKRRWGSAYESNLTKIRRAVEATSNEILVYQNEVIDPLYHASCGGERTEDAQAVWGGAEVPYLKSVPCTGHQDRHASQRMVFTLPQADLRLGTHLNELPAAALVGSGLQSAIKIRERTGGGRVKTLAVQGKMFSGSQVRKLLGLPSSNFEVKSIPEGIEVTAQGYGHGVGLCQYGAGDMAAQGKTCREILAHYYRGVEFVKADT
jgi:stage II sporulation protein D